MGDATEDFMHPELLMESGHIVLVTVNYRLGPMGFLSLGFDKAPGNLVSFPLSILNLCSIIFLLYYT